MVHSILNMFLQHSMNRMTFGTILVHIRYYELKQVSNFEISTNINNVGDWIYFSVYHEHSNHFEYSWWLQLIRKKLFAFENSSSNRKQYSNFNRMQIKFKHLRHKSFSIYFALNSRSWDNIGAFVKFNMTIEWGSNIRKQMNIVARSSIPFHRNENNTIRVITSHVGGKKKSSVFPVFILRAGSQNKWRRPAICVLKVLLYSEKR